MSTLGIALAAAAALAAVITALKYLGPTSSGSSRDGSLGNVSEAWLSEERGRKDR